LAIGRSTLRNQGAPGVVDAARDYLEDLPLRKFHVPTRTRFRRVLDEHTDQLQKKLPRGARNWGAARKALNIFLRDVVYNQYLCRHYGLRRLERWLEVPLDKDVAKALLRDKPETMELPRWRSIKRLTPEVSKRYQTAATTVAKERGVARIHLDLDYWRANKRKSSTPKRKKPK
jgi:hypothetical protein